MSAGGRGFLHQFTSWGGGGGGSGGHHSGGQGRGGNHPDSQLQRPRGRCRGVSFEEDVAECDLADNYYGGEQYLIRNTISESEYKARQASILNPDGAAPMNNAARGAMPPPSNAWQGQQGSGLYPTMNMPGPQGQQGQSLTPLGGRHMNMPGPQGQQVQPPTTGPPGGGQSIPTAAAAPQRRWPNSREGLKLRSNLVATLEWEGPRPYQAG